MGKTLEPSTYACPLHRVDLTDEVTAEATSEGTVVVSDGAGLDTGRTPGGMGSGQGSPRPFDIRVHCPGDVTGAKDTSHEQRFTGVVS